MFKKFTLHFFSRQFIVIFFFTFVFFILLFRLIVAFAAEVIVIVEGSRDLTIGSDTIDFGTASISLSEQTVSGITFGAEGVKVDDLVSGAASWSVTVAVDDFVDVSKTIPYSQLEIKGDTDGVIDVISGPSDTTGVSTFSAYTAFSGEGAQSDAITLISADSRDRSAVYQAFPEMRLTIPANAELGNYTNTFTFTFIVT